MALSEEKIREYQKRLLLSRMRILCSHGFYGLLLMHISYSVDESAPTAYTDGEHIAFGPEFLEELSDSELDFVMMHEILHVVLQHCFRNAESDGERYNIAADIVINSIIMQENGGDPGSITLSRYGESMHIAPDGKEGHLYTAEKKRRLRNQLFRQGEGPSQKGTKKTAKRKSDARDLGRPQPLGRS